MAWHGSTTTAPFTHIPPFQVPVLACSHHCSAPVLAPLHPRIPLSSRYQFYQKVAYIAVMMRRMLYAVLDPACIDDRDYYGNKRLELAGGRSWD